MKSYSSTPLSAMISQLLLKLGHIKIPSLFPVRNKGLSVASPLSLDDPLG